MKTCSCPDNVHQAIDETFDYLGKKWSLRIIKGLFFGDSHFKDFLEANPNLSSKVLSERLKELEKKGVVPREVICSSPVQTEYHLTEKGIKLNRVLFELMAFAVNTSPTVDPMNKYDQAAKKDLKESLKIES
jgi:DNA-binding HxlR family transcriptional regulator